MGDQEREDLRATAEDLLADAQRLKEIERRKLELDPADPEMLELAVESESVARRMAPKAAAQRALSEGMTEGASG